MNVLLLLVLIIPVSYLLLFVANDLVDNLLVQYTKTKKPARSKTKKQSTYRKDYRKAQ